MRRVQQVMWQWGVALAGATLALVLCAWFSSASGLPLDDAWIHQDFARTLVTTGQFAFAPGHSAAGETSPLYALLLTPPYLLADSQPPIWLIVAWSDLLGIVTLAGLAVLSATGALFITKNTGVSQRIQHLSACLSGIAILTEWHLIWSSASGMETMLFALLALLVLVLTAQGKHPLWIGLLVGLTLGVRPEGWLLFVVVLFVGAWTAWRERTFLVWIRAWMAPFLLAFLPGAALSTLFNLLVGGSFLPTTFQAKSAEFGFAGSILLWIPQMLLDLIVSSPILVLLICLGLLSRIVSPHQPQPRSRLSRLLWCWSLALLFVYASQVDPNYHHDRYLLPALPPLLLLAAVSAAPVVLSRYRLLTRFAFLLLLVCVPLCALRAAAIYQADVGGINCAEVDTGQWLRAHLPPGALIAAHDVGAIGFFSGHTIVDITGLVDPELIPLLHDPAGLELYLKARHVAYVAIYQDWFPSNSALMRDLQGKAVYSACGVPYFQVYQTGW